jgi:hypothetical protein
MIAADRGVLDAHLLTVDPEALGLKLECLQPWEQVVEEEG